jgi:acyl-CoA thioester hydrolase
LSHRFTWPVRIYYEDTDSGGVVYYANYLKYLERARTEWLRSLGFEQTDLAAQMGVVFVVREVLVEYLKPARFNDLVQVTATVAEMKRASLVFEQAVERVNGHKETLVKGRITVACVDASSFKPVAIPTPVKHKMEGAF